MATMLVIICVFDTFIFSLTLYTAKFSYYRRVIKTQLILPRSQIASVNILTIFVNSEVFNVKRFFRTCR